MSYDQIGRILVLVGGSIVLLGLFFVVLGRTGIFGRLPGDFIFSNGNVTCLVPIASMLILSLLLTIILNVVIRLFNR